MSETTPTQSLEETLNKTDLGHMIYEKKNLIGALLVATLVGVIGWMSVSNIKLAQERKGSQQVFDFQNETWEKAKAGNLTPDELVAKFDALEDTAKSSASMIPLALEISKFLSEKEAYESALSILNGVKNSNNLVNFFIVHQTAILLEKTGKIDEAIKTIEEARKSKDVLMPAHLELELGRLHFAKQDFSQAKTIFESIINTYPNDEEAKLAKLYLGEIK
ncbi:MAG TPA: tetratricopeptide repeat protein [Bacteriovoracaceae bacterium]|nr:tetratricopeptide repeat protein [Bacteriovoracaceae bacterium]